MSPVHGLQISAAADGPALTPEQKRFNTLIKQIERARETLAAWNEAIPVYIKAHVELIVPLLKSIKDARRQWVFGLDRVHDQLPWTKTERTQLRELVCDGAGPLLDQGDDDDAELKALFNRHNAVDYDTEQQHARLNLKNLMANLTGVDLGDEVDFDSDEDLFRQMQQKFGAAASAEAASGAAGAPESPSRPRRKSAAQKRRDDEALLATQSLREVFRRLASALHPDRETDPVQRDAKTALMQKANQAYAANDLLALLELQLQIEQVDAGHIANASAQRVRHYNQILAEQLAELRTEAIRVETGFRLDFGLQDGWGLSPKKLMATIKEDARELRGELADMQHALRLLDDPVAVRRWLKLQRSRRRGDDFGFF
jgi:hypothetical protein